MLVVALLNKDYLKRPTIFEVASIPCVKKEILNFINTHNCQDELLEIMDLINPVVEAETISSDENNDMKASKKVETISEVSDYVVEALEEWAEIMHNEIKITDYQKGWFSKHTNCCMGGEIFGWLMDRVAPEQKRARSYCQKMLDLKIIENVDGKT